MKTTFAFLTHPVNTRQLKAYWPLTSILPKSFIRPFLKNKPFKILPLKNITDSRGQDKPGNLLVSPIHPQDLAKQDDEVTYDRILAAGELAGKLEFKMLGLGGYYAALADRKPMLYKHLKIPVTTGAAFSAWCVYEAAFKAARAKKTGLSQSTVTILSPANSIGVLCGRKFADSVSRIILSGEKEEKLEDVRRTIQSGTLIHVDIENDLTKAVTEGDIVINSDPLHTLFDLDRVKPGSIVCDVSIFLDIGEKAARERPDITAIDCKQVMTPFMARQGFGLDMPADYVCPGLAETILLSLEDYFVSYSLGGNVNPDKLDHIANVASRHRFEVRVPGALID